MSEYYDALYESADPTQRAGWRDAMEQATRFEAALAVLPDPCARPVSLLDLGCGPGALYHYLRDTGRAVDYTGVDRYLPAIDAARAGAPQATWRCADARALLGEDAPEGAPQFDVVVAIGALVDGQARDARARLRHVAAQLDALLKLATQRAALVVLRQEALRADPILALEPALLGASAQELALLMRKLDPDASWRWRLCGDAAPTDWTLWLSRDVLPEPPAPWAWQTRALATRGQRARPWEVARFWWRMGAPERARAALGPERADEPPEARAMRARLG